jgi:predicted dinucleotide-binding enzyme
MTKIGILGAGRVGGALGKAWAAAGHQVTFGVRDPNKGRVRDVIDSTADGASAADIPAAVASSDVILIAIPATAVPETAAALGTALEGKIVIDATNRFGEPVVNSVDTILAHAPRARVFRAFNSIGAENMERPTFGDVRADMFYCGEEGDAQEIVRDLIADLGFGQVYVGGLDQVGLVDNLGSLWVTLVFQQGRSRRMAFKLLTE